MVFMDKPLPQKPSHIFPPQRWMQIRYTWLFPAEAMILGSRLSDAHSETSKLSPRGLSDDAKKRGYSNPSAHLPDMGMCGKRQAARYHGWARPTCSWNIFQPTSNHGSAPAALASLPFDPSGPQNMRKTKCLATFLPFPALWSSFYWLFLFWLFLFSDCSHNRCCICP